MPIRASLLLPVLPFLGPVIADAIPLRPLHPGLNLLAAEEHGLAGLVVGNAVEIEPAADCLQLGRTRNQPTQFYRCRSSPHAGRWCR